LFYLKENRIF